jgi:phosphatidate cytidylyltransferase
VSTGRRMRSLDDAAELRAARRARAAQREAAREQERAAQEPDDVVEEYEPDADEELEDEYREDEYADERYDDDEDERDEPGRRPRAQRPARRERPRSGSSELLQRILIAVPLAIIAIAFVDIGGVWFAVLMALVSVLCLVELYRMLERWRPVALIGYVAAVAMVAGAHYGSDRTVLAIAAAAIPVTFLAVVIEERDGMPTVSIAGTLLGIFWIGLGFAHAELLRELPHGNGVVIDVMVGTFLADTGAYLGGRLFGRRPLAPAISPNKTVEGLCLGMLTAVVAVFVAGRFQTTWLTEGDSLLLGAAVAVLGPLGDLFESVVKRDAGAKDAGTLFGAHGGALDRLDAVIFTVVAGYYVWVGILH